MELHSLINFELNKDININWGSVLCILKFDIGAIKQIYMHMEEKRQSQVVCCLIVVRQSKTREILVNKNLVWPEMYTFFKTLKVEEIRSTVQYDSMILPINSYLYPFEYFSMFTLTIYFLALHVRKFLCQR